MAVKWFVIGLLIYATTALLLVAIGIFYFHEKLNVYEIIGIVAAIISLILLSHFT
mgnify:CR=1